MCNCNNEEVKTDLSKLNKVISKYKNIEGNLIPILQETQSIYGYLPMEAMEYIADNTDNNKASIYGVATFYQQFRLEPVGKNLILQCQGTACHVNGSKEISKAISRELGINPGETTEDELFTIEDVACLGCCSLAPVIMINGNTYGNLTPDSAVKIVRKIVKEEASHVS